MDGSKKRAMRICAELLGYFIAHGAQHMNIDFQADGEHMDIAIAAQVAAVPADLAGLRAALNEPRQPEMDAYYDSLLGNETGTNGYHLLGAVVDEAEVGCENGLLSIRVRRRK